MASVRGCRWTADPTVWSERVDEEPVKTRRMLSDYLQTATYEPDSAMAVGGTPGKVRVQDYTDGTIHLTLDGGAKRLVEVVVQVTPEDGESRVGVISDATVLADAQHTRAAYIHQGIRSQLERALDRIDRHQTLGGGFSMKHLIQAGERDR